ncbi:DUF4236 domain-containing protein [Alkaliphilus peptidifermentans]|uniref:Tetratricopeptide repeat-containing protein n=1 Tax=Alkaliphilus peptidifermentans DSM 18978 TaxID=1120976 RepID=A0A1G5ELI8_9FIRM|nr:DUF4236 domain-containing protein [Alkaliphilus peptidifermentans]SCY27855.1 Tetratricopeptide repeat-containing protein [Alkaliphilus peptidifermentans DSM 18978]
MGLRFNKTIHLGKDIKINLGKNGPVINSGLGKIRINANRKGIKTTASLGNTGLSYTKNIPLPIKGKKKENQKIEIVEKNTAHSFFKRDIPSELKANVYPIQSVIGLLGILLIFSSFLYPMLFFVGGLLIYIVHLWRKKASPALIAYKNAYKYYNSKNYEKAIESLNEVLKHPKANYSLQLVKAECLLELERTGEAYKVYTIFFNKINPAELDSITYWSPKANAIFLSLENDNPKLALLITESLPNNTGEIDFRLWKNYFKGLCFMNLSQYESAIQAFQAGVGKRQSMDVPFIDSHYHMGVAYTYLGKTSLAKQRFQRVYSANTHYKNISEVMKAISEGQSLKDIIS